MFELQAKERLKSEKSTVGLIAIGSWQEQEHGRDGILLIVPLKQTKSIVCNLRLVTLP